MDIIEFMSGLTPYVFDKSLIKRVAAERVENGITDHAMLDERTRDLLRADLLYEAYISPTISAGCSKSHGNYSHNVGSQSTYEADKARLYNIFTNIYKKYNDPKLEEVTENGGSLQWLC